MDQEELNRYSVQAIGGEENSDGPVLDDKELRSSPVDDCVLERLVRTE